MAKNPNKAPGGNRNQNQAPQPAPFNMPNTPFSHNHSRAATSGNQLQTGDPAADVLAIANSIRAGIYEKGYSVDEADAALDDGGWPGGVELLMLAKQLRDEKRSKLHKYEEQFLKHMQTAANLDHNIARVDFDALTARHAGLSEDEAEIEGTKDIIADLEMQRMNATDPAEQQTLDMKIFTLKRFIDVQQNPKTPLEQDVPAKFLHAGSLLTQIKDTDTRPDAVQARNDAKQLQKDALNAIRDDDKDMSIKANAYAIIAETHGKQPDQDAMTMAGDPRLESHNVLNAAEATQDAAELQDVLAKLSNIKAMGLARRALRTESAKKAERDLEDRYRELSNKLNYLTNRNKLDDPHVSAAEKKQIAVMAVLQSQKALRDLVKEKNLNTPMAKVTKWVGKHKVAVIGGSLLLIPIGAPIALGVGAGAGLLMGSGIDQRFRGMRSADKAYSQKELMNVAGGYEQVHDYAMNKFEKDRRKEIMKRWAAGGGGVMTSLVALNVIPPFYPVQDAIHVGAAKVASMIPTNVYVGGAAAAAGVVGYKKLKKK